MKILDIVFFVTKSFKNKFSYGYETLWTPSLEDPKSKMIEFLIWLFSEQDYMLYKYHFINEN